MSLKQPSANPLIYCISNIQNKSINSFFALLCSPVYCFEKEIYE
jgi:hypothetical protein